MRAALYVRVSTEDQAREGYSLDAQTRRLEAYCRSRQWEVQNIYRDEGYSGRNIDRPEYIRMMSQSDDWDVLLVLKMDRIHRNSVNFAMMMDDLNSKGKDFNSMMEKFDTTSAMGRFVMDVIQRIAQLESEQIGERVKVGMTRKAISGTGAMGSGHPYGYEYTISGLTVIDDEAQIVREIYTKYSHGETMEDITMSLNSRYIPSKKGGKWNRQSVCNILHNPLYTGKIRWDGNIRDGDHIPIIDSELYDSINGNQENRIP